MSFAEATHVESSGPGTYAGEIQPGWDVMGNADGGYLLAIAARAAADMAGAPDPISVTAHFLRPGRPGPVSIDTDVVRVGRQLTVVRSTIATTEPIITTLGTYGSLTGPSGIERIEGRPPDLPPPDECIGFEPTDTLPPPLAGKVELRFDPDDGLFTTGNPSGRAHVAGWFRLRDGETVDTLALLLAMDSFPPTAFNAGLPISWMPTIELTVHVRARPVAGWLRCEFITRYMTGGFLEVDGEIWDADDRFVAQSRQLALMPRSSGIPTAQPIDSK